MRLDKYLKVSRIIKRRTVAKEICESGRILINGESSKAFYKNKRRGYN
ncbi:ribosomal 50S subunit-recycling heat shock protein [Clostridium beijerinckii]|nr:ribosomal 50S subunit-recycling heat shock protein [Clostridium beijerinckii]